MMPRGIPPTPRSRPATLALLFAAFLLLTGCQIGYVLRAAKGQFSLLWASVPLDEALRDKSLSEKQKERLLLVARIKRFGAQHLGLAPTESYDTVSMKSHNHAIFTVSASPRDRLASVTWWFPVVGRVPYLGFFDLEDARKEGKEWDAKGFDIFIGRADAYSTLGWFKDPVTLNLLESPRHEFVEIILHEMTHATLYVGGQSEFNETLAMLVGKVGAVRFLEMEYGPAHPSSQAARDSLADERLFSSFIRRLFRALELLYGSSLSLPEKMAQREKIFSEARVEFRDLKTGLKTGSFDYVDRLDLNNASLLALGLYHRHFSLFEAYLERHGNAVASALDALKTLASEKKDMLAAMEKSATE